jgi:RHS repeat-associated protein
MPSMETFKYDSSGRRIHKSSSTGTSIYAYDGDNLIEETNSSGGVVARYTQTQNIDEPLAMLRSSATSYYNADGLGSVTSLTNSAGAAAETYTYDSFGKVTASSGSLVNPFQYTGRESDPETGLYYYRARYYDPSVGRFASEDPVGFEAGPNFYSYVSNQPTTWTDPSGLTPFEKHLSDCVRDLLKKYFPSLDFDKVNLIANYQLYVLPPDAITIGNNIYYKPGYFNGTVPGIVNIAHELVHVEQYNRSGGVIPFWKQYFPHLRKNGYKKNSSENEAINRQNEIERDLITKFGTFGLPCVSFCK